MSSNIEVEAKFKVTDEPALLKRLKIVGAKKLSTYVMEDYNFSMEGRDFWKSVESLRIRIIAGRAGGVLTYKPSGNKIKRVMATREYEVAVDDPKALISIFSYLGIIPLRYLEHIKRTRHNYSYGNFNIVIDEYPEVGPFIEIERIVARKSLVKRAKREVEAFAGKLGLHNSDRQTMSVGFLLKERHMHGMGNAK
ncbi:MAG: class IV adenylate cyclase [Candidatus Micrarchaeaceae archaeon]